MSNSQTKTQFSYAKYDKKKIEIDKNIKIDKIKIILIVNLHNNFKIENQIKKSQSQNIKELGDFCIQSQYEKLCPSSSIH